MATFYHILKLDVGEYVTCKNLYLDRFLPVRMPIVLESVITPDELYQALCSIIKDKPELEHQKTHYQNIIDALFKWTKYERIIHIYEDELTDFKYSFEGNFVVGFRPLANPKTLVEAFKTYDLPTEVRSATLLY